MTETEAEIEVRIKNAEWELKECGRDPDFFDLVLLNDSFQEAINKLFRTIRDWCECIALSPMVQARPSHSLT